jgi:hypothetical protein
VPYAKPHAEHELDDEVPPNERPKFGVGFLKPTEAKLHIPEEGPSLWDVEEVRRPPPEVDPMNSVVLLSEDLG